jgi:hypothetical protein
MKRFVFVLVIALALGFLLIGLSGVISGPALSWPGEPTPDEIVVRTPAPPPEMPTATTISPEGASPSFCEVVVDDLDPGFQRYGPSEGWYDSRSSDQTYANHAYWTYTTDSWDPSGRNNWATWTVNLPTSGQWEVLAYIPYVNTGRYDTGQAHYQIQAADGNHVVERDQNNNTGWVSLGTYPFNAGTNYFVRLEDVTPDWYFIYNGQQYRKTIKFDALTWSRCQTPGASVSISVDRGEGSVYHVGDPIRICYTVSRPIYVKIYDCPPGESCHVVVEGYDDGQGGCINGTVTPPTGWETVKIEAIENSQVVAQDETYFFVTENVDTKPPAGFCRAKWVAAISNTCSGEFGLYSPQRIALFSNYVQHPSPDEVQFGPFNPGTSLVFYIRPWGSCGGEYLSTSSNAHITEQGTNRWRIAWEDLPPDRADDYDDLIVDIECGIQPPCQDDAEFVDQSVYPTVQPGQAFQIYFKVRNNSDCTWTRGDYYLANINGTPLGANPRQELGRDVARGEVYQWTINMTAPTTPGTYRTQWMMKHGDNTFGPNMYIDVTVATVTYSISGRVTDDAGAPVSSATVSASGPANVSTTTGSDGRYILSNLPAGTYSVSASKVGHISHFPRSVTVPPNRTDVDFVLERQTYYISGQVADVCNNPISSVTISDGAGHTTTSDSNGNYTLSGLPAGTYTLAPTKSGYTFSPTSRTVNVPPDATSQYFTARPVGPDLALCDFTINPARPTVFRTNYINFTITNRGGARFEPPSGRGNYAVQVVLKKLGVGKLEEYHYVTLQPLSLVPLHALDPGESQYLQITNVFFFNAVADAELELFFQPDRALNLRDTILAKPITINPHPDNAWNCAADIAKVLVLALNVVFPETLGDEAAAQALLNMPAMFFKWQACGSDLICGAKAIAQYLLSVIGTIPAKLINLLADLTRWFTSPAPVCSSWLDYLSAIVNEWLRNGIWINAVSAQSPVYVLVTNNQGQRAGFLDDGTIVQEIPDARAVENQGGKVVIYPGTNTQTVRIKATDHGTMRLRLALARDDGAAVSAMYQDVPLFPNTTGMVDVRDTTYTLSLDDNGDGVPDRRKPPDELTISHCPADANGDGKVDIFDWNILVDEWHWDCHSRTCHADFNQDGRVDIFDWNILVDNWHCGVR